MSKKSVVRSIMSMLFLGTLALSEAQETGTLYFSRDSDSQGLYTLDTATGEALHIGESGVTGSTVGLAPSTLLDLLYGSKWLGLLHLNADGSGARDVGGVGNEGLAFDIESETLYGSINGRFRTIDPVDGSVIRTLNPPGADVEGLAFGNGGVYGLARFESDLYFYNPDQKSWSTIGDTGVEWDLAGLAFDPATNTLYGKGEQDTNLYSIDPITARATLIGATGLSEGGGLAFVIPEPATLLLLGMGSLALLRRRRFSMLR